MNDYKLKVEAKVLPVGTKVLDGGGREVGEITAWGKGEDGLVKAQALITDPVLGQKIVNGRRATFTLSSKVAIDD